MDASLAILILVAIIYFLIVVGIVMFIIYKRKGLFKQTIDPKPNTPTKHDKSDIL